MPNALVSVSDKTGIVEFAKGLVASGFRILSTGGTAKTLKQAGLAVTDVSEYTGFPEMMDGRVKTLHPKVHGGLLCLRDNTEHMTQASKHNIEMIDLVCVNLYPFEQTVAKPDVALHDAIENIDIGGPSMLRSAAKNYKFVTVVTDPADYSIVLGELANGGTTAATRARLALKVYRTTSAYDAAIDRYLSKTIMNEEVLHLTYNGGQKLRYGENPHQAALIYKPRNAQHTRTPHVPGGKLLHGKEMSYNNYLDADASFEAVRSFYPAAAVSVIKHSNPCGLATGNSVREALEMAWEGDIVSSYGSVISATQTIDLNAAEFLKGKFVEVLIAPDFTPDALDFLKHKSKDIRLIQIGSLASTNDSAMVFRPINGALLAQESDNTLMEKFQCVTTLAPTNAEKALYEFAYRTVKHVKSNAINICREFAPGRYMILGMGAGQPNRIDSLRKLAATKARENIERLWGASQVSKILEECVLASDAFFPFPDTIEAAHAIGIRRIIQPGGSLHDPDVIASCNKLGLTMICTGTRHFFH